MCLLCMFYSILVLLLQSITISLAPVHTQYSAPISPLAFASLVVELIERFRFHVDESPAGHYFRFFHLSDGRIKVFHRQRS